jgi:hypothetical protein
MRLLAVLGLLGTVASGCISVVDLAVDEKDPKFDGAYAAERAKGKKIAVAAVRVEKGLTRDQWFRRKLTAAVEGLVVGLIPYPWDLRAWYGPAPLDAESRFPADGHDTQLVEAVVKALAGQGAEAVAVDASKAKGGPDGAITLQALQEQAKAAGAEALYVVAYNEFTELRFKNGEDRQGEEIFHEVYRLGGSANNRVYIPSTALFSADGTRLLARARTHESIFYTPVLTWGWKTPFDGDGGFKKAVEFLGALAGRDGAEAAAKTAQFLVKRDFGGTPPPAAEGEKKSAQLGTGAPAGRG